MTKKGTRWVPVDLPANPGYENMDKLLIHADGADFIVKDEARNLYYCGTQELIDKCLGEGKRGTFQKTEKIVR